MSLLLKLGAASLALGITAAHAQPGTGPVATACESEIVQFCAGKSHQGRAIRSCLEANRAAVSDPCRAALDTTGRGRGQARRNAPN